MRLREDDEAVLEACIATARLNPRLGNAAPRLVDSIHRRKLQSVLSRTDPDLKCRSAGLAFAAGRLAALEGDSAQAVDWLTKAQSALDTDEWRLAARIAFELGCLYLGGPEIDAAEVVLTWGEEAAAPHSERSADILHLRALLLEARGRRQESLELYQRALGCTATAMSQLTRVLLMRDLAAGLTHRQPAESVALCGLALATIAAEGLDDFYRAGVRNVMSYALTCEGRPAEGAAMAQSTFVDATRFGNQRIELYALFNRGIALELLGDYDGAKAVLYAILRAASRDDPLIGWTKLRLAWLSVLGGDPEGARDEIATAARDTRGDIHAKGVAMLRAVVAAESREYASAEETFTSLARSCEEGADSMNCFVIQLWIARVRAETGRRSAARRSLGLALALSRSGPFTLSANWWSPQLPRTALLLAKSESETEWARSLFAPTGLAAPPPRRRVEIQLDGEIRVEGKPTDPDGWRKGRTGVYVLRRYFIALLAAYPATLRRDEVADILWPDSDGDRAIRNLYAATTDLRTVLSAVPGVRVVVADHRYRLDLDPEVTVLP